MVKSNGNVGIGTTAPAGQFQVGSGATPAFVVTTAGNIGIGTTSPGYKLEVGGTTYLNGNASVNGTLAQLNGSGDKLLLMNSSNYSKISTDANWGLNFYAGPRTVSDAGYITFNVAKIAGWKLHISGDMRLTGALYDVNNGVGTSGQVLSSTVTGVDWVDISSIGIGGSGTTNYLPKFTAGTTLGNSVLYESSGNVGIGTTSPAVALDIVGANATQLRLRNTTADATLKNAYIQVGHYTNSQPDFLMMLGNGLSTTNILSLGGGSSSLNSATQISLFTAANNTTATGTERLRIGANGGISVGSTYVGTDPGAGSMIISGNVGIGTTGPDRLLTLSSSSTGGTIFKLSNTDTGGASWLVYSSGSASAPGVGKLIIRDETQSFNRMVFGTSGDIGLGGSITDSGFSGASMVIKNGNVGIGTTGPSNLLSLYSSADSSLLRINSNAQTTGGLYGYSGGIGSGYFSTGAEKVAGSWTARTTAAALWGSDAQASSVAFAVYGNTGLTAGNTFTPTELVSVPLRQAVS
ncbi:hypothetical protein HYU91_02440 [Candidatus Collierbacteria bacterium]|nr:hypothetical protein [Candidatus Collierbacteria bacterium]